MVPWRYKNASPQVNQSNITAIVVFFTAQKLKMYVYTPNKMINWPSTSLTHAQRVPYL